MKSRFLTLIFLTVLFSLSFLVLQPSTGSSSLFASAKPFKARPNVVNFDKLPLGFEPNQGQADPAVKFLARGKGYGILIAPQEVVLKLASKEDVPDPSSSKWIPSNHPSDVLRLKLEGAQSASNFEVSERLSGMSNYFIGNDRSKWLKRVPQFAKVTARGVYPGVDMVYYGNQHKLEYDLVVHPGADPKAVRLSFEGAKNAQVNAMGDVEIETGHGRVFLRSPQVYQDDLSGRKAKTGRYRLEKGKVAFEIGDYDHGKPLVIDPVLDYSTYNGGEGADAVQGMALDASGNVYLTGYTTSTAFPTTSGAYKTTYTSSTVSPYVTKINAAGTSLIYSTYISGTTAPFGDVAYGIAVDGSGDAYVTGIVSSSDFPTQSPLQASLAGFLNVFVTELAPDGQSLLFSTYWGGTFADWGYAIAVNATGAYVTGKTRSSDFPLMGPIQAVNNDTSYGNAFVFKINPGGSALAYSTYLGGTWNGATTFGCSGNAIAVDPSGNAYVGGATGSFTFPTTAGVFQTAHNVPDGGQEDGFITKVNSAGTTWTYSTYLGGNWQDHISGIAVDASGDAYVTGYTGATTFPVTNAVQPTRSGVSFDAFVSEMNPTGTGLVYSTYLGGTSNDLANAIAIDGSGDAFVTGWTYSANFPTSSGAGAAVQSTDNGGSYTNAFVTDVAKIGPSSYSFYFSSYLGGSGNGTYGDGGNAIATDGQGNIYVAGFANSADFPTTAGVAQTSLGGPGAQNGFASEIGINTPTNTATNTATNTNTPTPTNTATITYTNTATNTPTITYTNTPTQTPTNSPTASPTNSPTATNTPIITDVTISAAYPNPVYGTGPLSVDVLAPTGSSFTWSVFTLSYRKVTEQTVIIPYNNSTMTWDLKDSKGTKVANGLYYVRMQVTGPVKSSKMLKVLILR